MTGPEQARDHLLRLLATPHADTRFGAPYLPAEVRAAAGCRPHHVQEALWGLVGDGLAYLDTAGQQAPDNWHWRLTAAGARAAGGGEWEPRDQQGYLRRLLAAAPSLDPLAARYVQEALRAFNARCYLASSVMLGVASERAFTVLAETFVVARADDAGQLAGLLENPRTSYNARFREFRKRLEPLRSALPPNLVDVLTLDAIADLLRVTRNAAGHPRDRTSTRTPPARTCRSPPSTCAR